jgi:hypothetical protein
MPLTGWLAGRFGIKQVFIASGFSTPIRPPLRDRKFADSLLEGTGFEPSVPPDGTAD